MATEAQRRPRIQNLTAAGSALAVTLLPLAVGVLLARTAAMDPLTPVNALVTSGGQRPRIAPARLVVRARTRGLLARGTQTPVRDGAAGLVTRVRAARDGVCGGPRRRGGDRPPERRGHGAQPPPDAPTRAGGPRPGGGCAREGRR
ncbi:hypothetical protein [Streptomyces nitrosporeus]|uniref:hypothetical protein n=1 Tax=Streptomyces nitrosporeus TaxID=28894 RepID=UPI0019BFD636|nr:hypothetical protein [Streptomyces nitrosporeus]GGZ24076.1 hypothetical protein GCM10010327_63650 [Streptomyces nitrosporeus]